MEENNYSLKHTFETIFKSIHTLCETLNWHKLLNRGLILQLQKQRDLHLEVFLGMTLFQADSSSEAVSGSKTFLDESFKMNNFMFQSALSH